MRQLTPNPTSRHRRPGEHPLTPMRKPFTKHAQTHKTTSWCGCCCRGCRLAVRQPTTTTTTLHKICPMRLPSCRCHPLDRRRRRPRQYALSGEGLFMCLSRHRQIRLEFGIPASIASVCPMSVTVLTFSYVAFRRLGDIMSCGCHRFSGRVFFRGAKRFKESPVGGNIDGCWGPLLWRCVPYVRMLSRSILSTRTATIHTDTQTARGTAQCSAAIYRHAKKN